MDELITKAVSEPAYASIFNFLQLFESNLSKNSTFIFQFLNMPGTLYCKVMAHGAIWCILSACLATRCTWRSLLNVFEAMHAREHGESKQIMEGSETEAWIRGAKPTSLSPR